MLPAHCSVLPPHLWLRSLLPEFQLSAFNFLLYPAARMPMPRIQDEFTNLPISRNKKFRLRRAKAGLCFLCGKPTFGSTSCLKHLKLARERSRAASGARRRNNSYSYRLARAMRDSATPVIPPKKLPAIPPNPNWFKQDEFTSLPLSRQRKYQLRKAKEKRCIICGEPPVTATLCERHMIYAREQSRKRRGSTTRRKSAESYRLQKPKTPPTDH